MKIGVRFVACAAQLHVAYCRLRPGHGIARRKYGVNRTDQVTQVLSKCRSTRLRVELSICHRTIRKLNAIPKRKKTHISGFGTHRSSCCADDTLSSH